MTVSEALAGVNPVNMPFAIAAAGGIRGGRHLAAEAKTPVSNLFVQMMNSVGVEAASFADSTGMLYLRG